MKPCGHYVYIFSVLLGLVAALYQKYQHAFLPPIANSESSNWKICEYFKCLLTTNCTYTVGIPWIWMGVGWTIPFFFNPLRIAAETNPLLIWCCWSCVEPDLYFQNLVGTSSLWSFWLEQECCLHQPGCETSSWHVHVVCLAYSGCSVAPSNYKESELSRKTWQIEKSSKNGMRSLPCFYRIIINDTFGHFFYRHQSW